MPKKSASAVAVPGDQLKAVSAGRATSHLVCPPDCAACFRAVASAALDIFTTPSYLSSTCQPTAPFIRGAQVVHGNFTLGGTDAFEQLLASIPMKKSGAVKEAIAELADPLMPK